VAPLLASVSSTLAPAIGVWSLALATRPKNWPVLPMPSPTRGKAGENSRVCPACTEAVATTFWKPANDAVSVSAPSGTVLNS
jgi:hypothetical protein